MLRQHRPLLLACEAIGWLHMAGKAKADFLRKHGGQPNDYQYERWFEYEQPPFPWSDLLQWVKDQYPLGTNAWPSSLTDFITRHTKLDSGLLGLLQAGHGMASGIEKNLPKSTSEYLNQDATHMWLSSPFGHPARNLLADPPEVLTEEGWRVLLRRIEKLLQDLRTLGSPEPPHTPNELDGWWRWREAAIGPSGWLRRAFLSTLAETRLPNNDVTLWDQSYVAAALFKAAVAGAILSDPTFQSQDNAIKQQTRWRVLTVGFGADHYEARAVRIGDWVGARRDIDRLFEKVRRLIEVDLAVGSLVYRDAATLAFTFPGLRSDATPGDPKGSLDDPTAEALRSEVERAIDQFAQELHFETPPLCRLSSSTRSFVPMVRELREARSKLAVPIHRPWAISDPDADTAAGSSGARHVCPVCQVRLNEPLPGDRTDNARKSRVCGVCNARRRGRLDAWLQGGDPDTIWITEVADANDRVALLTFSLEIEPWLEAKQVDSLRAQSIAEWRRFNPVLEEFWKCNPEERDRADNTVLVANSYDSLLREIEDRLQKSQQRNWELDAKDLLFANLQEGYRHEAGQHGTWPSYFAKIVEERAPDENVKWKNDDVTYNARWLAHQLFCKLSSAGRIHRFWRTAETFFDELLAQFREIVSAHENRWRTRRLRLVPDQSSQGQLWEDRETYTARFDKGPLEVLYVKDQNAFVTICNLARCLRPEQPKEAIWQGSSIELRSEESPDPKQLTIARVEEAEHLGVYHPLIVLDRTPSRFRVLVPLDRATTCIEAAVAKWREEFSRVWDRMPLQVGVVAFPRLTPFQAVIEAARNLEARLDEGGEETWTVREAETREGVAALVLRRPDENDELVTVPTRLPDGRDDVSYPNVRLANGRLHHPRDFQHPKGDVYGHIADLRLGDGIQVSPSRMAAMFLDTTGRRFERVRVRYLSDFARMRDVWQLIWASAPSMTAVRGAWAEIEDREQRWRDEDGNWHASAEDEWVEFARAVLQDRLQVRGARLDALLEAVRDGTLAWALEWHLTWLKERLGGES